MKLEELQCGNCFWWKKLDEGECTTGHCELYPVKVVKSICDRCGLFETATMAEKRFGIYREREIPPEPTSGDAPDLSRGKG